MVKIGGSDKSDTQRDRCIESRQYRTPNKLQINGLAVFRQAYLEVNLIIRSTIPGQFVTGVVGLNGRGSGILSKEARSRKSILGPMWRQESSTDQPHRCLASGGSYTLTLLLKTYLNLSKCFWCLWMCIRAHTR